MNENNSVKKVKVLPIVGVALLALVFAGTTATLTLQVINRKGESGQGQGGGGVSPAGSQTYTITWLNDDGTVLEVDNNVAKGATPTYDGATPTKVDNGLTYYTFDGWNHEVVEAVADSTYVAKYVTAYHDATVVFEMNGHGTQISPLSVEYDKLIEIDEPTEADYAFKGWYTEPSCTILWNINTDKVTKDITLYAKWEKLEYVTVTFDADYGDPVDPQVIVKGTKATNPGAPANLPSNITFHTWVDDDYDDWDFNTEITSDITLYMYYSEAI